MGNQLSLTDTDREEMLAAIGVSSVEELFRDIPAAVRFEGELDLEPALSEPELVRHLEDLAAKNVDTTRELSFLGMGIYDHYVPAVVDAVLQRGEVGPAVVGLGIEVDDEAAATQRVVGDELRGERLA